MSRLIPMEEAARMLGMSVERLTELRSNNEIFGYRDGSTWKFKMTELDRVADELGINMSSPDVIGDEANGNDSGIGTSGFDLTSSAKKLLLDDDEPLSLLGSGTFSGEPDSVELMEDSSVEIFSEAEKSTGEKAPGKKASGKRPSTRKTAPPASDVLDLDDDDDMLDLADSGRLGQRNLDASSSASFAGSSGILASNDDDVIDDDTDEKLSFGTSSLRLASESSRRLMEQQAAEAEEVLNGGSGKKSGSGDTGIFDDGDLSLSEDDLFSDELSLSNDSSSSDISGLRGNFEDSDDLVLDDSDSSTEISLEKNKSGINLSANESGISLLDEPLELGGSDIDALELPEDDDMIVLDDAVGPDQPTMMQEDDFNLTPLQDAFDDDDSSGSQVIALEDSEIYADDSASGLMGADDFDAQPAMLDETIGGDFDASYGNGYGEGQLTPGQMIAPVGPAALPEAPYSVWQVLSLGLVATLMMVGSMIAYNLAQNMWMPEKQVIGSSVLNFFLDLTGMN
jgi:hypothetical protein